MTFPVLGGNGAVAGFSIDNSLRFNDDDSAYLSRTPSSSGNQQIWTLSTWIKKCKTGNVFQNLFSQTGGASASQRAYVLFTDDLLVVAQFNGSSLDFNYTSNAKFRDVSAWLNLVISTDTTQATASNRIKIYINGEQITSFSSTTNPSQNLNTYINTTQEIGIGHDTKVANRFFDGYVAETHLIDGTAKAPTDFGEFDEDSGIWKPKRYSGSYGTNGFKLNFSDSGSLGADSSGNGNNFTPTNLASTDQMLDTPNNNFCTMNAIQNSNGSTSTLTEGNLVVGTADNKGVASTFGVNKGKWYWEIKFVGSSLAQYVGVSNRENEQDGDASPSLSSASIRSYFGNEVFKNYTSASNSSNSSFVNTNGAIYGVALDLDNGTLGRYVNGSLINTDTTLPSDNSVTFFPMSMTTFSGLGGWNEAQFNFGNPPFSISSGNSDDNGYGNFEYAPPSGYLAICTQNLATELSPTIDDGSQYFNTTLVTSTGSDITINTGFKPDFLWTKSRSYDARHELHNTTSGDNKRLVSNLSTAEETFSNYMEFTSNGATFKTNLPHALAGGGAGRTGVAWSWRANGGTTSSNTDGSITSTVQANTTAGFSIVTYTGTGANATVGHGLGVAPKVVIIKNRDSAASWMTYHEGVDASNPADFYLFLNSTGARVDDATAFQDTEPTSTVFSIGNGSTQNQSGANILAYCFAEIEGYSKMGSYTGNGTDFDGAFAYTGFKPSFLMVKNATNSGEWGMFDSARNTFNVVNARLGAESNGVEYSGDANRDFDFLSNGFKVRNGSADVFNTSGDKFIYMCFAENPSVISTGVPNTAR